MDWSRVDFCDAFITTGLDSHSDATHSRVSYAMPNFSFYVLMKKQTYLHLGGLRAIT